MSYRNLAQGAKTLVAAFDGDRLIARGEAGEVVLAAKRALEASPEAQILVFDDATGRTVDIDLVGTDDEVVRWLDGWVPPPEPTRPRAYEVSLLPRHWEWLDEQPAGASAALRRLVEAAMRSPETARRRAQEAAYRFVLTMAGDREGFEAATRALFAGDVGAFRTLTESWPPDVRERARELLGRAQLPDSLSS